MKGRLGWDVELPLAKDFANERNESLLSNFSPPPFPLPHITYHRPEVVARYGEHLVADALLHATVKGMEGDTGITVAEALLQYIQYAAHLKNAVPDRRGVEEKDADGGVQLHH